ncbi:NAD(P)-dependent oxidoreductase [Chloroflexota bacterium]
MGQKMIGFIGLGDMGKPMAKNLLKAGFGVTTCGHVRKEPIEELRILGAIVVDSPKEVAEASEVIIVIVRDTAQANEVIRGGKGFWEGKGIWQGIKRGSVLIVSSTVEPSYCQKLVVEGKEKGIDVLDVPVSGARTRAEDGTLSILAGGDEAVFERCRPIFEAMGRDIFYLGGPGMGQAFKLVNNYIGIVTAFTTSEGIAMGLKAGLDLTRMLEVIKVSSGNNSMVQRWDLTMAWRKEHDENRENSVIGLQYKDVGLAVKFAEELGVPATLGEHILQMDDSMLYPSEPPK